MVDIQRDTSMQKLIALTEENNKILKKMKRAQTVSNIFRALYWVLILAVLFGSFYFIQPLLTQVLDVYQGLLGTQDVLQGVSDQLPDVGGLGDILGGLGGE